MVGNVAAAVGGVIMSGIDTVGKGGKVENEKTVGGGKMKITYLNKFFLSFI